MKIALFSCFHGRFPDKIKLFLQENKIDAIFCCGDLCNVDSLRDIIFSNWNKKRKLRKIQRTEQYRRLVASSINSMQFVLDELNMLNIPVYLVIGNNDYIKSDVKGLKLTAKSLEERIKPIKKFKFLKNKIINFNKDFQTIGISNYRGLSLKFPETENKRIISKNKTFTEKLQRLFSKIKNRERAIVLAHDIPYGIFDIAELGPFKGRHIGDRIILEFLQKYQPLIYICGHMHEYQGLKYLNKTMVINPGAAQFGRFAVLELDNDKGFKDVKFYQ